MKKIRLLTFQQIIEPYRFKFYEALKHDERFQVTGCSNRQAQEPETFGYQKLKVVSIGTLKFQYGHWKKIFSGEVDVVIASFDLHVVSNILLMVICKFKKIGFCWWGLGFGKSKMLKPLRVLLVNLADGLVVYEESAKREFIEQGISPEKIFVKHNTVYVEKPAINRVPSKRDTFLVVGTLSPRKEIGELIRAFASKRNDIPKNVSLSIIGEGSDKVNLELLASSLEVSDRVIFHGKIQDESLLQPHFNRAIAMVHPGQAGLSVLHAMAYGVPFVTKNGAISGGEIENIESGINGVLYSGDVDELAEIISGLALNREESVKLGENSFVHYTEHRSMEHMAQNYLAAAAYAYNKKIEQ
jgi:glycosyltransferase involved in cell wall biosynthesis